MLGRRCQAGSAQVPSPYLSAAKLFRGCFAVNPNHVVHASNKDQLRVRFPWDRRSVATSSNSFGRPLCPNDGWNRLCGWLVGQQVAATARLPASCAENNMSTTAPTLLAVITGSIPCIFFPSLLSCAPSAKPNTKHTRDSKKASEKTHVSRPLTN